MARRLPCRGCGEMKYVGPGSRPVDGMIYCRKCRDGSSLRDCVQCGQEFRARRLAKARGGGWVECCSKSCARQRDFARGVAVGLRDANSRIGRDPEKLRINGEQARRSRRARLAGVIREPYTAEEIGDRDGWMCGLCACAIDPCVKWPDPESPSVDHIVPISRGGDDTKSNVQIAHLRCNLAKGAGRDDEDLPVLWVEADLDASPGEVLQRSLQEAS